MKTGDSWENHQSKEQSLQADKPCRRSHQGWLIQCIEVDSLGASYVNGEHDTFRTESNDSKQKKDNN